MGEGAVKIPDQSVQIGSRVGLLLHFFIPLPDRHGHFALAHISADDRIALVDALLYPIQHLLKIRLAFAEARRTEQENLLVFQALQKRKRRFIRSPLIRPEANIQLFGFDRTGFVRAEMIAQIRRKALPDRLSQQSGISRPAGINNGVALIVHKRILSLL